MKYNCNFNFITLLHVLCISIILINNYKILISIDQWRWSFNFNYKFSLRINYTNPSHNSKAQTELECYEVLLHKNARMREKIWPNLQFLLQRIKRLNKIWESLTKISVLYSFCWAPIPNCSTTYHFTKHKYL